MTLRLVHQDHTALTVMQCMVPKWWPTDGKIHASLTEAGEHFGDLSSTSICNTCGEAVGSVSVAPYRVSPDVSDEPVPEAPCDLQPCTELHQMASRGHI